MKNMKNTKKRLNSNNESCFQITIRTIFKNRIQTYLKFLVKISGLMSQISHGFENLCNQLLIR